MITVQERSATTVSLWAKPLSQAVHFLPRGISASPVKTMPLPARTRTWVLIWAGGMEHRAANRDLGIPVLQPLPCFPASSPCPIPRFGTTSATLLPCFGPITLALPEQAKPEGFAGQGEGPAAPAHPAWATRLAQLMGTRCDQEMATLSLLWAGVGIL